MMFLLGGALSKGDVQYVVPSRYPGPPPIESPTPQPIIAVLVVAVVVLAILAYDLYRRYKKVLGVFDRIEENTRGLKELADVLGRMEDNLEMAGAQMAEIVRKKQERLNRKRMKVFNERIPLPPVNLASLFEEFSFERWIEQRDQSIGAEKWKAQ